MTNFRHEYEEKKPHTMPAYRIRDAQGLTPIMKDTLYWLSKGLSYAETARRMGMKKSTFQARAMAAIAALRVSDRDEAVEKAREMGIIDVS